ncbi:MAG: neutral/alkaline non-lysosomal ceramidase N-terminal domain-containing protein [Pirellulales bacterium]
MIQRSVFIFALVACLSADAARAQYQAGFAKMVITPDEMTWLSGYGGRTKPAEGKVQDLYAKAVAFEDKAGTRLVLITLDLGSVNYHTTEYVAAQAKERFDLPRGNLILNCSHTHCAPEVGAERRIFLDNISEAEHEKLNHYIDQLNVKLVDLVGKALADLQPSELSVSRSTADFAFNRRHPSGIDPNGVTDREVPVLRVTDPQGKLRGVLFGYACHNTTLNFQLYCGDYAGFAQADVEEAHPGAIAMFVMGCGGDQNPQPRRGDKGLRYAEQHGRELADAVEQALAGEQQAVGGSLHAAFDVATLDLEPLPPLEELRSQAKLRPSIVEGRKARYLLGILDAGQEVPLTQPCPIHVVRFGEDLLMIFISGETVVDYSLRCKREFHGPFVWVPGYCDDVFAYLPSRRVLLEGGYEGRTGIIHQLVATPFERNVEDRVMACVEQLVSQTEPK